MNTATRYRYLTLFAAIIFFIILYLLSSLDVQAKPRKRHKHRTAAGWHWREVNRRGIERYEYNRPGWPAQVGCSTYYTNQPVKSSSMRRLHFYRRVRG